MNVSCPVCRKPTKNINIILPEKEIKAHLCVSCQICFLAKKEYNLLKTVIDEHDIKFKYPIMRIKGKENKKQDKTVKQKISNNNLKNIQGNKRSTLRIIDGSCSYYKRGICLYYDDKCNSNSVRCIKCNGKVKKKYAPSIIKEDKIENPDRFKNLPKIDLRDFIIRTNVFKCTHSHHSILNIDAVVTVIENSSKETQIKIPAGYCQQCKLYFIMESTYQELKKKGIILCRITDEKSYLKSIHSNGMQLAQESILMQYGYNVSQTEGLYQHTRQQILAILIDNKILSKSEIISYLDFFISQRAGRSNMMLAISKWETDREFVENYRAGEYTKYGVNAIYRR